MRKLFQTSLFTLVLMLVCFALPTLAQFTSPSPYARFQKLDADPPSCAIVGRAYVNTTLNIVRICTASGTPGTWITIGSASSFTDNTFTLKDDADNTKQAKFELANVPSGTTNTYTVPPASTNLLGDDTTNTVIRKSLDGTQNTFSNIPESAVTNLSTDLGNKLSKTEGGSLPSSCSSTQLFVLISGTTRTYYQCSDVNTWGLQLIAPSSGSSANQIFGVNNGNTAPERKTLVAGTGITITHGVGTITFTASGGGTGDASTNTTTSVVNEVPLFADTSGKLFKRASGSGIGLFTSGVLSYLTAPTGAIVGTTDTQTLGNKTFDNTNSFSVKTNSFTFQDPTDTTKQLNWNLSGLPTVTTVTLTPPNASDTLAVLGQAQTFSGVKTFSNQIISTANGAASAPAVSVTGTPYTGGTTTNTYPLFSVGNGGYAGLSTSGTMIGVNAPSGFTGNLFDLQLNGASKFSINANGDIYNGYNGGITI